MLKLHCDVCDASGDDVKVLDGQNNRVGASESLYQHEVAPNVSWSSGGAFISGEILVTTKATLWDGAAHRPVALCREHYLQMLDALVRRLREQLSNNI